MGTYILPTNDHRNDKTLGWALWHLVFNVSTVVRNKVTKKMPEKQLRRTTLATRESNSTRELLPLPPLLWHPASNMFWSLFIFRGHSVREPASSRVTCFILYLIPCMIRWKKHTEHLTRRGQSVLLLRSILAVVTDRQYGQFVTWLSRSFLFGTNPLSYTITSVDHPPRCAKGRWFR